MRQMKKGGNRMRAQWLTVQSFQHGQELLSAINALSIHLKLGAEGITDEARAKEADEARIKLSSFLDELEKLVEESDRGKVGPVLGKDPRTRQLAESFVEARRERARFRSVLFRGDIPSARRLLHSEAEADRGPLLQCLREMRFLIQEHVQADATQIMGQV
jgi:hypothetical protein